jgi:hypothetical protein
VILEVDKKKFLIHKGLLCYYSRYFQVALNGSFKEDQKDPQPLLTGVATFALAHEWFYHGTLNLDISRAGARRSHALSIALYHFADMYDIPGLRRATIDSMSKIAGQAAPSSIKIAYKLLPEKSAALTLLVEKDVHHKYYRAGSGDQLAEIPSRFLAEVLIRREKKDRFKRRGLDGPRCMCHTNTCHFHEHESDEEKAASMWRSLQCAVSVH